MGYSFSTTAPGSGGSGPTQNYAWADDKFEVTDPFTPGSLNLALSQTVVFENGIFIVSEGMPLFPPDYTFIAPNQITIEFGADPATQTDDGIWLFHVQYQYAV